MDKDILDKIKTIQTTLSFGCEDREDRPLFDFSNPLTLDEAHREYLEHAKKTKAWFKDCDEVEVEEHLIDENFRENAWKNINVYTFDVLDNFFIKSCVLNLKINGRLCYKMYFSIEGENVFLYSEDSLGCSIGGGVIAIKDAKFLPMGAVEDSYYKIFAKAHVEEGLKSDRQTVANRFLMNSLLYFLLVNELFHRSKEVITETTRRVDIAPKKNGKKKKKQPKKTKVVRYIKIDGEKIKRIREEQDRAQRESYERHTAEWTRVGHYRRLRNGEVKWIKPSVCKAKNKTGERVPKLYKLK